MLAKADTRLVAMKATSDPTVDGNWASVGGMIKIQTIESLWAFEDGGDIHVATQNDGGEVRYHVFDPGTDTWTTQNEFVVKSAPSPTSTIACSIALRSDGDVIIGYGGDIAGDQAVFYARREGTTWTTDVQVDGATGSNDYRTPVLVLGASDRIHFFYKDSTANDLFHRSLSSTNVLDTADQTVDLTPISTTHTHRHGVSYVSGATKVRIPYVDADGTVSVGKLDSGADPTISTDTAVSGSQDVEKDLNGTAALCMSVDGTILHILYSDDTDQDIFHNHNSDDSGWGTDDEEVDAVTANRISCNVYTRSSIKRLAFLYLDATTVKYAERDLEVNFALLSSAFFPDQNYYVGPFEI